VWVNTIYTQSGAAIPTEVIEQRTVWLIPLWVIVLVGFLLAYSAVYFIWRALRKRRAQRREVAARRRSHRERDLEAEERRRRREERAAQAAEEMRTIDGGHATSHPED
jgi:flagellar biosynthesis/type III secretory pathway M-ring protein FliF/YscJ